MEEDIFKFVLDDKISGDFVLLYVFVFLKFLVMNLYYFINRKINFKKNEVEFFFFKKDIIVCLVFFCFIRNFNFEYFIYIEERNFLDRNVIYFY